MAEFKSTLLNNSYSAVTLIAQDNDEPALTIDSNLRKITVPQQLYNIGVAGDHLCEEIFFECPRYFDGNDLSEHDCIIRFINAGKEYGESNITNMTVNEDSLVFGWKLDNYVTRYSGVISFTVQFETAKDGIQYQWQTTPAQLNILAGLNIEQTITEKDDVLFRTLSNQVNDLQKSVEQLKIQVSMIDSLKSQVDKLSADVKYLQENVVYTLDE